MVLGCIASIIWDNCVIPECFYRGSIVSLMRFPLKMCGNDKQYQVTEALHKVLKVISNIIFDLVVLKITNQLEYVNRLELHRLYF